MNTPFGLELISRGGPLMIALLICSVLAFAIIIERIVALRRSRVLRIDILMEVEIALKKKDLVAAMELAKSSPSCMTRIAEVAIINSDKSREDLKSSIEEAGRMEVPRLEKFMTILQTITVISPLLGLLGTVTGMINVFQTIVSKGTGNANVLAGGISEALLTTAAGLSIAIPTLIFYNFFNKRIEHLIVEMEHLSVTLFELLTSVFSGSK